jgi:hypothetical protein
MLHACVQRFDVTENLKKFCKILGTKHVLPCVLLGGCRDGRHAWGRFYIRSDRTLICLWCVLQVATASTPWRATWRLHPHSIKDMHPPRANMVAWNKLEPTNGKHVITACLQTISSVEICIVEIFFHLRYKTDSTPNRHKNSKVYLDRLRLIISRAKMLAKKLVI